MEAYQIKQLNFKYDEQADFALRQIDLKIKSGSITLICGKNGCGKTTLLKQLKSNLLLGKQSGEILYFNQAIQDVSVMTQASEIGYLNQNVEEQIVHDKVNSELAFSLEALGYDRFEIHKKVMEMASYFGLQTIFHQDIHTLSGGWKQCLNLASIMVLQPKVLLLDEPFSQLDPIACDKFLSILNKIKNEFQTTMIIVEQRLDLMLPFCEDMILMDEGKILIHDQKKHVIEYMLENNHELLLPDYIKLANHFQLKVDDYQLKTIKASFEAYRQIHPFDDVLRQRASSDEVVLRLNNISFAHQQNIVLKDLNMEVCKQDIVGILGSNGSGKSTLLQLILNKYKYIGKIQHQMRFLYVPQKIQLFFEKDKIKDEFNQYDQIQVKNWFQEFNIWHLYDKYIYELSLGEQHKLALIKMMMEDHDGYLLDEISKGLDEESKNKCIQVLQSLKAKGKTIILVSHDVEFIAKVCNKVGLLFDHTLQPLQECYAFFKDNYFYTTMISKVVRSYDQNTMILEDYRKKDWEFIDIHPNQKNNGKKKFSLKFLILALLIMGFIFYSPLKKVIFHKISFLSILIIVCMITIKQIITYSWQKHDLYFIIYYLLVIPITIYLLGFKNHYISFILMFEIIVPFIFYYFKYRISTKQLILLASLCSVAIASRVLLLFFPQMKIVAGLCILVAIVFGKEFGFWMAAFTMLASNIVYAQGAWTPFQMIAMGLVAYFAPILLHKQNKWGICIYAFLAIMFIYGMSMNYATLIYTKSTIDFNTFLVYELSGISADFIHAMTNVIFLYYFGEEFIAKLMQYRKLNQL